jgi:dipeptidyl aminopeptidase/acylaminoacyl peptidase
MPGKKDKTLRTLVVLLWLGVVPAALGVGALLVWLGLIPLGTAGPASTPQVGITPLPPALTVPPPPTLTPLAPVENTAPPPASPTPPVTDVPSPTAAPPSPSPVPTRVIPRQAAILFVGPDGCHVQEVRPESGVITPLTLRAPAYSCYRPEISPDGTRLAFLMPGTNSTLYDMNVDGSGLKRISLGHIYDYAWSPDGQRLAYASLLPDQGGLGLVFINADGSGRTYSNYAGITITPDAIRIAWSPDGQWVYAPVNDPSGADQSLPFALNANGVDALELSTRGIDPTGRASWSPDSRSISLLIHGYDYGYSVSLLNFLGLDGVPLPSVYYDDPSIQSQTLSPEGKFTAVPFWSPDGRRAALPGISSLVAGEYQLLTMDREARAFQLVADLDREVDFAAWDPAGERIAFLALPASGSGEAVMLELVNADGSGLQTLAGEVSASPPVWVAR